MPNKEGLFLHAAVHFSLYANSWEIKTNLVKIHNVYLKHVTENSECSFYFVDKKPTEENIYPSVSCCRQTTGEEMSDYEDD